MQAKALGVALQSFGDVVYIDFHSRNAFRSFMRKSKKILFSKCKVLAKAYGILFELIEFVKLNKMWKKLPSTNSYENIDIVVLGSDEIWNLTRNVCKHPMYWGGGLNQFKISYAPSLNTATESDLKDNPDYIRYLKDINFVSVRDLHSKEVLSCFLQDEPFLAVDPTLLNTPELIDSDITKPYIAVYLFYGSLSNDEVSEIKKFAKSAGMPLISAGQYISWCDRSVHSINGTPFYVFENARFVITNTFHGTAYAINYNTQFAVYAKGKPKIEDLLKQFELTDRIVTISSDLHNILDTNINYERINLLLHTSRSESMGYIQSSIQAWNRITCE